MLSKKDICSIIVSGMIGLAGCGNGNTEHSHVKKSAQEYQRRAETRITAHGTILNYDRAHYRQLLDIIETNDSLLRANKLEIDISGYVKKAEEYRENAEGRMIVHWAIIDYKRAQYEISKAIIKQQQALRNKIPTSVLTDSSKE